MPATTEHGLSSLVRRVVDRVRAEGRSDADLLAAFRTSRDEAAFAALVARHGPLVWGVCRRLLSDPSDAEDAFQATFLTLLHRANDVRVQGSLSGWLYTVARRVVHTQRRAKTRRASHEQAAAALRPEVREEVRPEAVGHALDEALAELPDKFREPLVLCHLQGKSHAEAAEVLGCSLNTLAARLARGGEMLRGRLARRGMVLSLGQFALLLVAAGSAGATAVPTALVRLTVASALAFVPGRSATSVQWLAINACAGSARVPLVVCGVLLAAAIGIVGALWANDATAPPERTNLSGTADRAPAPTGDAFGDALPDGATLRFGTLRFRTGGLGGDSGVAFGPGGRLLFSVHGGDRVFGWDGATGREVWQLQAPAMCSGVTATADGRQLVAAGTRETWAWDISSGRPKRLWQAKTDSVGPSAIECSPDGRLVATSGARGKSTLLLNTSTGAVVRVLPGPGNRFTFSPDSKRLAAWVWDKSHEVHIWDVGSGGRPHILRAGAEKRPVTSATFTPDAASVVTVGHDQCLRVWDAESGSLRRTLATDADPKAFVAFVADRTGPLLAEVGGDRVRYWDVASGRIARPPLPVPTGAGGWAHRFSADGLRLAAAHMSGAVLWDCAQGRDATAAAGEPNGPVYALSFSADGSALATLSYDQAVGTTVHLWDAQSGVLRRRLDPGPRQMVWSVNVTGGVFACVGNVGEYLMVDTPPPSRVAQWDPDTGAPRPGYSIDGTRRCSAFSPDGRLVACGTAAGVALLDRNTGRAIQHFAGAPRALAFSADGGSLAAVQSRDVVVWSLATGHGTTWAPAAGRPVGYHPMVAVSRGGRLIAVGETGRGGKIRVVEAASGVEVQSFECPLVSFATGAIAFSPDDRLLAAGDSAGVVHVWELASGRERHRFTGHRAEVLAVSFSPEGRRLASGSIDCTALMWDLGAHEAPPSGP